MELSKQWEHNSLILTLTYQGSITTYLLKIASIAVHVISAFVTSNSIICTIGKLSLFFDGVLFQSSFCTIDSFYVCSKTFSCCFWLSLRLARRVTKEICLGLMHVEFFVIVLTCFAFVKTFYWPFCWEIPAFLSTYARDGALPISFSDVLHMPVCQIEIFQIPPLPIFSDVWTTKIIINGAWCYKSKWTLEVNCYLCQKKMFVH